MWDIDTIPVSFPLLLQMRTVNVVLSLCLNLGVDPPDVVKTDPCARLECWIGGEGEGEGWEGESTPLSFSGAFPWVHKK